MENENSLGEMGLKDIYNLSEQYFADFGSAFSKEPKGKIRVQNLSNFLSKYSLINWGQFTDSASPVSSGGTGITGDEHTYKKPIPSQNPHPMPESPIVTEDRNQVRSKNEAIIYNVLLHSGLDFCYEPKFELGRFKNIYPDFKIKLADGSYVYWEHLGLLNNKKYSNDWQKKQKQYASEGITIEKGNLIVTSSDGNEINSYEVAQKVDNLKKHNDQLKNNSE